MEFRKLSFDRNSGALYTFFSWNWMVSSHFNIPFEILPTVGNFQKVTLKTRSNKKGIYINTFDR